MEPMRTGLSLYTFNAADDEFAAWDAQLEDCPDVPDRIREPSPCRWLILDVRAPHRWLIELSRLSESPRRSGRGSGNDRSIGSRDRTGWTAQPLA